MAAALAKGSNRQEMEVKRQLVEVNSNLRENAGFNQSTASWENLNVLKSEAPVERALCGKNDGRI